MLADYHVHTQFSDDSDYPLEDVVRDAVSLHLDEICITDHVDYGVKADWDSGAEILYRQGNPLANVDYPCYFAAIERMRRLYRDLGGSIVTIGSDSHSPAHLGTYLQEAKTLLKELGFRHFCTCEKMQPAFHPL